MVRRTGSDRKYKFGFWPVGLLFLVLQKIPYFVIPLMNLQNNPILKTRVSPVCELIDQILALCCTASMLFVISSDYSRVGLNTPAEKKCFFAVLGTIMLNYFGWLLYFAGYQNPVLMMIFLVMLPPLYYFFIGLWRHNRILSWSAGIFGLFHCIHMLVNFSVCR